MGAKVVFVGGGTYPCLGLATLGQNLARRYQTRLGNGALANSLFGYVARLCGGGLSPR